MEKNKVEPVLKEPILQINNLSISFGSKSLFHDFSLALHRGERLVIEGPNGCGKTTLLKCILGMVKPQKGSIVLSSDVNTAYCKQGFSEVRTVVSVYEVVSMGLYNSQCKDHSRAMRAMRATGVESLAKRAFSELSGGEKQRVNLARCICQEANLLLLDEPSSFLDVAFRDEFVAMMRTLPEYMAAIVVTHDEVLTRALGWQIVRLGSPASANFVAGRS